MATAKQKAEATPAHEIDAKARAAQALADNPVWQEMIDEIENETLLAFRNSKYEDTATRERCHAMLNATQSLRRTVQTYINSGQLRGRAKAFAEGKQ